MKKITSIIFTSLFLFGCQEEPTPHTTSKTESLQPNEPTITPPETQMENPIVTEVNSLSLEEKVGQMILTGFNGTTVPDSLVAAIEEHHIGNVILFSRNITSIEQLRDLNNNILNLDAEAPIWISIDEEGGNVSRIPPETQKLPSAKTMADNYSPETVAKLSSHLADLLDSLGFAVNFAPVMDINSNPNNPVIGTRAFTNSPISTTDYSLAFNDGLRENNILGSAKHFPGHGDTNIDSHLSLPVIQKSLEELEATELKPFTTAIEEGIEMIMVGHLLVPTIDTVHPSSQSKLTMTDLLRGEMNYNGIIITDDLHMQALSNSVAESSVNAIKAGADIALVGQSIEEAINSKNAIVAAVKNGIISEEQINESVLRILSAKKTYIGNIDPNFNHVAWNNKMKKLLLN